MEEHQAYIDRFKALQSVPYTKQALEPTKKYWFKLDFEYTHNPLEPKYIRTRGIKDHITPNWGNNIHVEDGKNFLYGINLPDPKLVTCIKLNYLRYHDIDPDNKVPFESQDIHMLELRPKYSTFCTVTDITPEVRFVSPLHIFNTQMFLELTTVPPNTPIKLKLCYYKLSDAAEAFVRNNKPYYSITMDNKINIYNIDPIKRKLHGIAPIVPVNSKS